MNNVTGLLQAGKTGFGQVAAPFLDHPGLPFADVLSAADIEQAFAQRDALFATGATFSTPIVLWAFLAQALKDGKGAACAAAVADIATYMQQVGGPVPSGDTGDYCRARAKLDLDALRSLTVQAAERMENQADSSWLFHGLHPKLIDGFTFTMPDTHDNQRQFPQQPNQRPGAGFPIARACVVLSLATAAVQDMNIGPYAGKRTEELVVVTSLTDPDEYPAEAIAALYGYRWNAELDIRAIKQTLGLDHVRCKTPEMVRRELWVTLLAYNLIRKLIATAAAVHDKQPRQIGFTLACQTVLSSWMLVATGVCRDERELWKSALERIAANEVANRPGRIEPRMIKRDRQHYPMMHDPRRELRRRLCMT